MSGNLLFFYNLYKKCRMNNVTPAKVILLLVSAALVSACGTSPSVDNSSASPTVSSANVFSNISELDYNAPQQDYKIGSNDLLDIKVFQAPELSQPARVDPRGNISLPLIGTVRVEGLSQGQLEKQLAQKLGATYLQDPQVTVFIQEFTAQRVTVEGEVKTAGVFPIKGDMTLVQAIALSGGLNSLADPSKTVLFRKQGNTLKAYNLDLNAIRDGKTRDPYLRNDDRVIVHRSDARFWLREVGSLMNPFSVLMP